VGGEHTPGGRVDLRPQPDRVTGPLAPQVEIAVLQARLFARRLVELEGQRCALPQHGQGRRVHLDVAGGDLGVRIALRSDLDDASDGDAELGTQSVRGLENVGLAEHHLRHPGGVAKVDEDHAAVIATTGDPTGQRHRLACIGGP
jgi:hypothetical protein